MIATVKVLNPDKKNRIDVMLQSAATMEFIKCLESEIAILLTKASHEQMNKGDELDKVSPQAINAFRKAKRIQNAIDVLQEYGKNPDLLTAVEITP